MSLFGDDLFGEPVRPESSRLARRYHFTPFDVLDGRSEEWKERKRAWLALGIASEAGREAQEGWNNRAHSNGLGEWLSKVDNQGHRTDFAHGWRTGHDVSVFDPALAELCIRFWSEETDVVFDPYAGGSVRGVVAGTLGREYRGNELREEQVVENRRQANISRTEYVYWTCGDAWEIDPVPHDLLFTCPPYGNLERYSSDPRDLSTMEWPEFIRTIVLTLKKHMRATSKYAVIVCNSYREKAKGNYRGLCPLPARLSVDLIEDGEWVLWEDCAWLTPLGTVPVRASHNWKTGHKLGRCHQRVLVFKRVSEC